MILCFILSILKGSFQLDLRPDNNLEGIIYRHFERVFIQKSIEYITYKFNVSAVKHIVEKRDYIESMCPNGLNNLNIHDFALKQLNMEWDLHTNETYKNENPNIIFPTKLIGLQNKINLLSVSNCNILENITSELFEINEQLDKLAHLNFESLNYFISPERIQSDVLQMMVKLTNGSVTPFNQDSFFSEFWKFVNSKFYYQNDTISIEFEIPIFDCQSFDVFTVNVKPIIWENKAYLFDTEIRYAIIDVPNAILFTMNDFKNNCFMSSHSIYCKSFEPLTNKCYNKLVQSNTVVFDEDCFIRLKDQNMITQIDKQLYFTVFSPIDLLISRQSLQYMTRIEHSVKIIENIGYNITTSFFHFSPNDQSKYEIFFDENVTTEQIDFSFRFQTNYKLLIWFIIILSIIMTTLLYVSLDTMLM